MGRNGSVILYSVLAGACTAAAIGTAPPRARALSVPVFMYHHVQTLNGDEGAAWYRYTVSPTEFERQLDWLSANRFTTISAAHLGRALRTGEPLPANPVVLTFDDGWACCYETVFPLLRARGMTATFFIYPSGIDAPAYLTWDQLREMQSNGMDIQAHTLTHPHLPALDVIDVRREIGQCREVIAERLGRAPEILAYPFGEYDGRIEALTRAAGYTSAHTTDPGITHHADRAFRIQRVLVNYGDPVDTFAALARHGPAGGEPRPTGSK